MRPSFSSIFKKVIRSGVLWAAILGKIYTAQAQQATTTVNLVLSDVISIESNSAANGGTVDFHYETESDYHSQKMTTVPNSLIITFSQPFDLKVKANGASFENGPASIPVNVLSIKPNENSQLTGPTTPVVLSTEEQVLASSVDVGSQLSLDLDYYIPENKSTSSDILGKPAGIYTQKITYTVSAL